MVSVSSQLIEEVTAHAQSDSLEDAWEICADSTYFPNNLRISIVWNVILRIILYIAWCLFFAQSFVHTILLNTGTWNFSYFQESYMILVRRIKPFFIIVTSYQERSTCLCGYVHLLMFGCGWRSLYHYFWSFNMAVPYHVFLLLQGVMWTNQKFFSKATILCTIPWEDIWQHFCKSYPLHLRTKCNLNNLIIFQFHYFSCNTWRYVLWNN